nr:hypothetical protein [Microbacterium bovistercoris]
MSDVVLRAWSVDDAAALVSIAAQTRDLGTQTGFTDLSSQPAARSFIASSLGMPYSLRDDHLDRLALSKSAFAHTIFGSAWRKRQRDGTRRGRHPAAHRLEGCLKSPPNSCATSVCSRGSS